MKLIMATCFALSLLSVACGLVSSATESDATNESADPVGQTLFIQLASKSAQFCFDKFSYEKDACSGIYRTVSGTVKSFVFAGGSCSAEGLKPETKVGDPISVRCVDKDGKSCFAEAALPDRAIDRKSATAYANRVWGDKEDAKNDFVQIRKEKTCKEVFEKPAESNAAECSVANNQSSATASTQGVTAPATAKLVGSALACFSETNTSARAACLIRDAALEVYTSATFSQVAAGTAEPERCYVNIPGATEKEPKNLFIYRDASGNYQGARASGAIEFSAIGAPLGYFTASFPKFWTIEQPISAVDVPMQAIDVLYPKGDPDPVSGAWQMGQFVVARFVAKEFCASKYLKREYPTAEISSATNPQTSSTAPTNQGQTTTTQTQTKCAK